MRTNLRIIPVLVSLVMLTGLYSCQKKADHELFTGKLKFTLSVSDDFSTMKSGQRNIIKTDTIIYSSYQILITVEDLNGGTVIEDKLIPLYSFGNGFVTEQIEIKTGDFFLKKFMVINSEGQVIYASPLADSPRAYLVNQPLPLFFTIKPDITTQIAPEVLLVDGYSPSDFGYTSFRVEVVNTRNFYVLVQMISPSSIDPPPYTAADLFISGYDGWGHYYHLEATVNKLEVRYSDYYELIVFKEGYPEVRLVISVAELIGASEENPFIIYIETNNLHTLVLQPGPDDGKDAWLSDLNPDVNFGNYRYFESSFLSDSILTVMRTTRSLIYFNQEQLPKSAIIHNVTLTLHYDIPIPWEVDSSWFYRNKKCNCLVNGAAFQQIIEPWEENKVTWNNQPQTTEISQVMLFPFVKNANFIDIDVTGLFVPDPYIDSIPLPNYGILMRLYPEESYPGFRFVSSDYPDEYMRPRLKIQYSLPGEGTDK